MRYLVTGAAGFIGARFVESCNKEEIELLSVDKLDNFSRPEHDGLDFGLKLDTEHILGHLENDAPRNIDAIIHLGAISDTTCTDMHELRRLNTDFSADLWKYAHQSQIPFVYASSASTYGDGSQGFNDDEATLRYLKPLNDYGASKHAFDIGALMMERNGITPPNWAGFKFFNVYGYGEAHKGRMASMVYQAFRQIQDTKSITLFRSHREGVDDGMQSRDFIYVDDVVKVLHWGLASSKRGIYNLGTGKASPFLDLALASFEALGVFPKIEWVDTPEDIRDQYQYFTQAEMGKLRNAGYRRPMDDLRSGIKKYAKRLGLR